MSVARDVPRAMCRFALRLSTFLALGLGASDGTGHPIDSIPSKAGNPTVEQRLDSVAEGLPEDLLEEFEALNSIRSDLERSLALDAILLRATDKQVSSFLTLSKGIRHNARRLSTQDEIFRRLASTDALQALSHIDGFLVHLRQRFEDIVISEWALNDLNGVLDYIATLDSRWDRIDTLTTVVEFRDDLSEKVLLDALGPYGLDHLTSYLNGVEGSDEIQRDPEAAWYEVLDRGTNYVHDTRELAKIARALVDERDLDALEFINESIPFWRTRQSLLSEALSHAAERNPQPIFEKAVDMFENVNWNLIMDVADVWLRSDPDSAVEAFRTVGSESLRSRLFNAATRSTLRANPQWLQERPEIIPDVILAVGFSQTVSLIGVPSPEQVSLLLVSPDEDTRKSRSHHLVSTWAMEDFDSAFDWVMSYGEIEDIRDDLFLALIGHMDPQQAEKVFETVALRDIDDSDVGWESMVVGKLAESDPDRARELLHRVRGGMTQLVSYVTVGLGYVEQGKTSDVIALGSGLPELHRSDYFEAIYEHWSGRDPKRALKSIDRLSSDATKSRAAYWLLHGESTQESLSARQVRRLKSLLNEEDALSLDTATSD